MVLHTQEQQHRVGWEEARAVKQKPRLWRRRVWKPLGLKNLDCGLMLNSIWTPKSSAVNFVIASSSSCAIVAGYHLHLHFICINILHVIVTSFYAMQVIYPFISISIYPCMSCTICHYTGLADDGPQTEMFCNRCCLIRQITSCVP